MQQRRMSLNLNRRYRFKNFLHARKTDVYWNFQGESSIVSLWTWNIKNVKKSGNCFCMTRIISYVTPEVGKFIIFYSFPPNHSLMSKDCIFDWARKKVEKNPDNMWKVGKINLPEVRWNNCNKTNKFSIIRNTHVVMRRKLHIFLISGHTEYYPKYFSALINFL